MACVLDLLRDGLTRPCGEGDLRIQPLPDAEHQVLVTLYPDTSAAAFSGCAWRLKDFLERTYRCVPAGAETGWVDIDAALARLRDDPGEQAG